MQSNHTRGNRLKAFGRAATFLTALVILEAAAARPAEAAPFAYLTNWSSNTVTVLDIATNTVTATIAVGSDPVSVAVSPDGKFVYVANEDSNTISVIATATNTVTATIGVGLAPLGVAVSPDGKFVYVTNTGSNTVSVIATAGNTVTATVGVGSGPGGVAVSPDGKFVYVANFSSNTVSVIATATSTVMATVGVGLGPFGIAVSPDGKFVYVAGTGVSVIDAAINTVTATVFPAAGPAFGIAVSPDGKFVYVTNYTSSYVSVIATAGNTLTATVGLGIDSYPRGVAVTPDGKSVYVALESYTDVSVIATASNMVTATVGVRNGSWGIAIAPTPFAAFKAALEIDFGKTPNTDVFGLLGEFTLGHDSKGIYPPDEAVSLSVGTFSTTIPAGSFQGSGYGPFYFLGTVDGVDLQVGIVPTGAKRYALGAAAEHASLTGTTNPVPVILSFGGDAGSTSVNAVIH